MIDRDRFNAALAAKMLKQSGLARILGVSPSAISQLVSGKTRSSSLTPKIARILDVSEDYLLGLTDDPFDPVAGSMTPRELAAQLNLKLSGRSIIGDPDEDSNYITAAPLDLEWLVYRLSQIYPEVARKAEDEEYFPPVITVKSSTNAMSPTINMGDEVYFYLEATEVQTSDAVWLINYGGLRMIRRLMLLPGQRGYRVYADNQASPTFEAPLADVHVIGRAFWLGRPIE